MIAEVGSACFFLSGICHLSVVLRLVDVALGDVSLARTTALRLASRMCIESMAN